MKWLIFIFLVTACGKHIQPAGKDIRDREGDQIVDGDEVGMNKFIANISPIENIQMTLKLKGYHHSSIVFENRIDMVKHAKDFMVKNTRSIPKDDYFSEWSQLMKKEGILPEVSKDERYILKLSFNRLKNPPTQLRLKSLTKTIETFEWASEMEISLTKEQYLNLQNNSYHFSLTKLDRMNSGYQIDQWQSVKENTYRVLINDGESAQIFYVAIEYSFDDFLKGLKIHNVLDIEQVNLLTTTHKHSISQWWVRTLNGKDKIVLKDDLKNITAYRLEGFTKKDFKMGRKNGHTFGQIKVNKHPSSVILLKIRGYVQLQSFSSRYETKTVGKLSENGYRVKQEVVDVHPNPINSIVAEEILDSILINDTPLLTTKDLTLSYQSGADQDGPYLELMLETDKNDFLLTVPSLPQNSYRATGVVRQRIDDEKWEVLPGTAINPEGSLNLSIEAYIEKL